MKRRDFSFRLAGVTAAACGATLANVARAQAAVPAEGTQYVKLGQPVPVASSGKVEVIEFFWYGCPHCNALEPSLEQWVKRLPADVHFGRSPVAFSAMHATHARIFYTLDIMGQVEAMHRKVFAAIHNDRKRLDQEPEIVAFMTANGLDGAKFREVFASFSVQTKTKQGQQLSEAYRIDGVPALGVQGRYYTSPALAGGNDKALAVADYLIGLGRKSL